MIRLIGCIAEDHDPRLIILACMLCVLAANTSVSLLGGRRDDSRRQRALRSAGAVLALGIGVWATHFIGILAYRPDLSIGFDGPLCVLSLILAIAVIAAAYTIVSKDDATRLRIAASGVILTAGVGAMHFAGMQATLMPGTVHYDLPVAAAGLGLGALFAVAAMAMLKRRRNGWATVFLTLTVVFIHFIGMGSMTLDLADTIPVAAIGVPRSELALAAGVAALLVISLTLAASWFDRHVASRFAREARRFRTLADTTFEGLIFEHNGQIVDTNRAMCELAGAEAASLIGRPLSALLPGVCPGRSDHGSSVECVVQRPDGRTVTVEVLWRSGPDQGERVVAVRDISHEKAIEGRIERMVRFDPLTGLANRELFDELLHKAIAMSDRTAVGLALLYIDLDRFESIDEDLGHVVAEEVLIQTARRLTATVRETDTVARVGRDEFAIIQSLVDQPGGAAALADRIVAEIVLPLAIDGHAISVTASVGVALYPANGTRAADLIKNAVLAVRQAKHDGRGRWRYFEPGMDLLLRKKRSLEHDLRIALRDDEFSLNFQPFVETATLNVVGYEALLRWDHPERGRISPADFIPLAEECGLIVQIGSWVLSAACAEAMSWDEPLIVSVNLSPAQFLQPGIVNTVADVLQQTGLPPNRLELEITEGTLMEDTQNALEILTSLKALGLKIAMDDFGTGYSSLGYLRKFPFDKIKIDRSFISDVEDDTEAETIVQAIIAMSRSLRLDVTAEGVETKQQLSMLRALGCNYAQGYLLGRPRSAGQLDLHGGKQRWMVIDHAGSRVVTSPAARSA